MSCRKVMTRQTMLQTQVQVSRAKRREVGKGPRQSGEACETAAKAAHTLNRQKRMLNRKNLGIMAESPY